MDRRVRNRMAYSRLSRKEREALIWHQTQSGYENGAAMFARLFEGATQMFTTSQNVEYMRACSHVVDFYWRGRRHARRNGIQLVTAPWPR